MTVPNVKLDSLNAEDQLEDQDETTASIMNIRQMFEGKKPDGRIADQSRWLEKPKIGVTFTVDTKTNRKEDEGRTLTLMTDVEDDEEGEKELVSAIRVSITALVLVN